MNIMENNSFTAYFLPNIAIFAKKFEKESIFV